jgi:hypothetical protein
MKHQTLKTVNAKLFAHTLFICIALAFFTASCASKEDEPSKKAWLTVTEMALSEGESAVTTIRDLSTSRHNTVVVNVSDEKIVSASLDNNTLIVTALSEGEALIQIIIDTDLTLTLKVTVSAPYPADSFPVIDTSTEMSIRVGDGVSTERDFDYGTAGVMFMRLGDNVVKAIDITDGENIVINLDNTAPTVSLNGETPAAVTYRKDTDSSIRLVTNNGRHLSLRLSAWL